MSVAKEWPKGSGKMMPRPDLGHVARHVGRTSRATCGSCHFFSGGGEGVKHGVMDASLVSPDRTVDVHMSPQGADLSCTDCHTTVNHRIAGRYYDQPAYEERAFVMRGVPQSVLGCETCHGDRPHPHHPKLNDHTDKVSCQACHIPLLAPAKPTKMWWDWSQAGRFGPEGKPLVERARVATDDSASDGSSTDAAVPEVVVYDGMKGSMMYWPLPHMVAPKEQSLRCADCHHSTESRLAGLGGFYLGLKLLIFPIQGITGLIYFYYDDLSVLGYLPDGVGTIALIYTAGAFALLTFLMAHLYMTTTGETLTSNLRAMITGREEFPTAAAVEPDRDLIPQNQSPHTRR